MNKIYQKSFSFVKNPAKRRLGGFTLAEFLAVVLILAILAAIAWPRYQTAVWKSRYVQLITGVDRLSEAQEIYYMENGIYDADGTKLSVSQPPAWSSRAFIQLRENGKVYVAAFYDKPLYYVRYQKGHGGSRQCRVLGKDKIDHRVCSSLTGIAVHMNADDLSVFSYYRFPD